MDHYVGIDVSLELGSLCVLDATGRIVREAKVASEPEALIGFLSGPAAGPHQLGGACRKLGDEPQKGLCCPLSRFVRDEQSEAVGE